MFLFQPRGVSIGVGAQVRWVRFRNDQLVITRRAIDRRAGKARGGFELLLAVGTGKRDIHKHFWVYSPSLLKRPHSREQNLHAARTIRSTRKEKGFAAQHCEPLPNPNESLIQLTKRNFVPRNDRVSADVAKFSKVLVVVELVM